MLPLASGRLKASRADALTQVREVVLAAPGAHEEARLLGLLDAGADRRVRQPERAPKIFKGHDAGRRESPSQTCGQD